MKNESRQTIDLFSEVFEPGPGLEDGDYAIVSVDIFTNHYDFVRPDMPQALALIAEIQGKRFSELQLPPEAESQNWLEEPCEPYALSLSLENGASVWLPLIEMEGADGKLGVFTEMVEGPAKPDRETSHNAAATEAAVDRAARRREEKAARKAEKQRKTT